jgi:Ca2+/Na+ antiporter
MLITQLICFTFLLVNYMPTSMGEAENHLYINSGTQENLNSLYGVEVNLSCNDEAHPFGTETFEVLVKNNGLIPETVKLIVEIMYKNEMILRFEEDIGKILPGVTITRGASYYPPFHTQDGESLDLTATAYVHEDPSEMSIYEKKQYIIAADLEITNIRFSKNEPVYGDNITIWATILNNGHDDDLYDCFAIFYCNGLNIGKCEVENIPIKGSVEVNIPWIAIMGSHIISVKIPINGNGNNIINGKTYTELSKKINVEDSNNNLLIVIIEFIIGLIFIVGICYYIIDKKSNIFNIINKSNKHR